MAFDISSDSFLSTLKIDLNDEIGEGAFVELREPTKKEFLTLALARDGSPTEVAAKFTDKFAEVLPKLIINHGFVASGKPATNDQVAIAIGKRIGAENKVETEYITWATTPFQSKTESE